MQESIRSSILPVILSLLREFVLRNLCHCWTSLSTRRPSWKQSVQKSVFDCDSWFGRDAFAVAAAPSEARKRTAVYWDIPCFPRITQVAAIDKIQPSDQMSAVCIDCVEGIDDRALSGGAILGMKLVAWIDETINRKSNMNVTFMLHENIFCSPYVPASRLGNLAKCSSLLSPAEVKPRSITRQVFPNFIILSGLKSPCHLNPFSRAVVPGLRMYEPFIPRTIIFSPSIKHFRGHIVDNPEC